jgi:hypothetical protein
MIHGQKFCGFRVGVAFLMTVIFMILLHLWVNGRLAGLNVGGSRSALRQPY